MADLASLTASLGARYGRTYVAPPPEPLRRRNGTELPVPMAGDHGAMLAGVPSVGVAGESSRQRIRRPGSARDNTFKPKAVHYAYNPVQATARVTARETSRTIIPGKVTRRASATVPTTIRGTDANGRPKSVRAHFDSADADLRKRASAKEARAVAAGEIPHLGI